MATSHYLSDRVWTGYTGDGGASLDERIRAMYGDEQEKCQSCDQRTDADQLVRTVNGPTCIPCMAFYASEAELTNDPGFVPAVIS